MADEDEQAPVGGADRPRGTLYVVATPIGNLGDVTVRALEILRAAAVVAAEDTRMTRRLWARHGIATPLVSYHAHSPASREAELLARLASGADLALVTDAGTPLVSDPGEGLVAAWAAAGGRVVPVPGPSADLWPGQTDEIESGFSYPELDRLLFWRIDKRRSIDEVVALGFKRDLVERVDRMVAGAEFKRQVPPIAKLGPRTAGVDYLYPRRRPGSARE